MGERNYPEKTLTGINKYPATLEKCKLIKNKSSLQEDDAEPQVEDSPNFLLLPRLSEWAALSSVPFSKLRKVFLFSGNVKIK